MANKEIRAWRERLRFNEVGAAQAMRIPVQSYRNYEDGRTREPPGYGTLRKYIERYGVLKDV